MKVVGDVRERQNLRGNKQGWNLLIDRLMGKEIDLSYNKIKQMSRI